MADDRPVESLEEAVARLSAEVADLRKNTGVWMNRRPTGTIEPTLRGSAQADTLFMQGQTVSRTTYAVLWAWVQAQGLVTASLFTNGDGTTTFGLPDFRDRVPYGVSAAVALGTAIGANNTTLAIANLPAHGHSVGVTIDGVGDHDHFIAFGGGHGGHVSSSNADHPTGAGYMHGHPPNWGLGGGDHNHNMNWNGAHSHGANVSQSNVGSGTAFDNRQAGLAINWAIWT